MRHLFFFAALLSALGSMAQEKAFGDGEWFKFRVHYGFVTAGYATLQVDDAVLNGKEVYHIKGEGKTMGVSRLFFKVEDDYQSYIDKDKDIPYRFIRKIDEGGYTKDIQIDFDWRTRMAVVHNKEKNTKDFVSFSQEAQDMVSAFYYLRNHIDVSNLKEGDSVDMDMFFDKQSFRFRLKFLGRRSFAPNLEKLHPLNLGPMWKREGFLRKRKV